MAGTPPPRALLIIDMQNDFCPPHGALAIQGGRDIAKSINELASLPFKLKIATRDFHPADHISFASQHEGAQPFTSSHTITSPGNPKEKQSTVLWPDHCVQNTSGCELIDELDRTNIDMVVDKGDDKRVESYSAFGPPFEDPPVSKTKLEDELKRAGIEEVWVVGLAFDYCVKHTAIDAAKAGFTTYVLEDTTRAVDPSEKSLDAVRKDLRDHGVRILGMDSKEMYMLKRA